MVSPRTEANTDPDLGEHLTTLLGKDSALLNSLSPF